MRFALRQAAALVASSVKARFGTADDDAIGRRLTKLIDRRKIEVEAETLRRLSQSVTEKRAAPLYEPSVYGRIEVRVTEDVFP